MRKAHKRYWARMADAMSHLSNVLVEKGVGPEKVQAIADQVEDGDGEIVIRLEIDRPDDSADAGDKNGWVAHGQCTTRGLLTHCFDSVCRLPLAA